MKGSKTRPHHRNEPTYEKALPEIPPFVEADPLALMRWRILAPKLSASGVLTDAHGEMLALLCSSWADLERAREQFAEMKYRQIVFDETVSANGERKRRVKPNPLISRIEKLAYQVARFLGEFGLTPMTSAKVNAEQVIAENIDPFDKFLSADDPFNVN